MSALLQPDTSAPWPTVKAPILHDLLNLKYAKGASQGPSGAYDGPRFPLTLGDVEGHLRGATTVAFAPISGDQALFAAVDVDERFPELSTGVIRRALFELGGQALLEACFLTNGSDGDRGKIIITFAKPMSARLVREFILRIKRTIQRESRLRSGMLDAYPQDKSGGVVRVLGRNLKRNGPLEFAFNFDGELTDLTGVAPLSRSDFSRIARIAVRLPTIHPWAERLLTVPWVSTQGTHRHRGWMCALAQEAIRLGFLRSDFECWMERVKLNSPELGKPSRKNGDARNVLDRNREGAWNYAMANPTSFRPKESTSNSGSRRAYRAMYILVKQRGLGADWFQFDYQTIGDAMGCDKGQARRAVLRAEKEGLLVRHDHGSKDALGHKGICTTYGLVGEGETTEHILNRGRTRESRYVIRGGERSTVTATADLP
jgi:hypothetical protein